VRILAPRGVQWVVASEMAAIAYDKDKVKVVRLGSNITEPVVNE